MTENGLDGALLGLYKPIAEVTEDILAVSGAPSDIGTAAARVRGQKTNYSESAVGLRRATVVY